MVDDDPLVIDLVSQLLGEEDYRIESAANGYEALEELKRRLPDVILLDLLMPGMDGFSVLSALQEDAGLRDIPVIVLTAKSLSEDERSLLKERSLSVRRRSPVTSSSAVLSAPVATSPTGARWRTSCASATR